MMPTTVCVTVGFRILDMASHPTHRVRRSTCEATILARLGKRCLLSGEAPQRERPGVMASYRGQRAVRFFALVLLGASKCFLRSSAFRPGEKIYAVLMTPDPSPTKPTWIMLANSKSDEVTWQRKACLRVSLWSSSILLDERYYPWATLLEFTLTSTYIELNTQIISHHP